MSSMASPATARLHRSLETALSPKEQFRIAVTLGGGMLSAGLFAVGVVLERWGPPERQQIGTVCQAIAALLVVLPMARQAIAGLLRRDASEQVEQLVTVASLAALAIGDFYTATLVPLIAHLGHFLEERSVMGAQAAVAGLRQLEQKRACLLIEEGERIVDVAALRVGDRVVVRPGELLPADGIVCEGASTIDQSSITGESAPAEVAPGSTAFAGTMNLSGRLVVEVTGTGADTALGRVVHLLQDAEQSKTPLLRLIEQYAGLFLLLVLSIAGVVLFLTRDVYRAIAVLVVGCPGPFILAGPSAMVAALSVATRAGILIKNSKFLESLADVTTVVLDKTGTVTLGDLRVVGVEAAAGVDERELLFRATRCARGSAHPVSRAISHWARQQNFAEQSTTGTLVEASGLGVTLQNGETLDYVGRRSWLEAEGFVLPPDPDHSGSLVWAATRALDQSSERRLLGAILLADQPRPEARSALSALRRLSVDRLILLTGDRRQVAEGIGDALEVDETIAEVLPEQKLNVVERVKRSGRVVAVVGDGVNDSLALASGDVGIAMGALGSDIAIQSADLVLATSDLTRIPFAIQLARRTRSIIHQNVLMGAAISFGMLALASAGWISPLAGAVLHNVGELYVLLNSARLLRTTDESRSQRHAKRPVGQAPA
ncbi:MAG: cation-translocating P-type ATPase [Planctomycetaceae bacterium]